MKQEQFDELKAKYPLINELCGALGLEYDFAYYQSPEYRHKQATDLANKYFSDVPYLPKQQVLVRLKEQYPDKDEKKKDFDKAVLNYWLGQKIVSEGEGGLLFLGKEVPAEFKIKSPIEKANFLASELLAKNYMPKLDLLAILAHFKIQEPEKELEFWLNSKIVGIGYAVFGTMRQTRQEIVFLGNCPF